MKARENDVPVNNPAGAFLDFFIYSNLFIALCTVLMTMQTYQFLLGRKPDLSFTTFVFFSTICSYSFHWYLTQQSVHPGPRIKWISRFRFVHLLLFVTGLAGAAIFFWPLREFWAWILTAALATFLYSAPKIPHPYFRALRKLALGKTLFLAFIWMYVTTLLPVVISSTPWNQASALFVTARFFFVYAICILFDFRDREDDRAAGIRSLITFLSNNGILILFIFSLIMYSVCSAALVFHGYSMKAVVLLLIPAVILASLYRYARTHFGDLFYYFVLDGLMALSAVLMLVAGI